MTLAREKFVLDVPVELIEAVGQILQGSDPRIDGEQYERAKTLVDDFIDHIMARARQTGDNHLAFVPHGNSISREE